MFKRMLIVLAITVGVAFVLGLIAAQGIFGSQGWAVALIAGAIVSAAVAVSLAPLNRRRTGGDGRGLHLLRR